jgi:hypothetical protein
MCLVLTTHLGETDLLIVENIVHDKIRDHTFVLYDYTVLQKEVKLRLNSSFCRKMSELKRDNRGPFHPKNVIRDHSGLPNSRKSHGSGS